MNIYICEGAGAKNTLLLRSWNIGGIDSSRVSVSIGLFMGCGWDRREPSSRALAESACWVWWVYSHGLLDYGWEGLEPVHWPLQVPQLGPRVVCLLPNILVRMASLRSLYIWRGWRSQSQVELKLCPQEYGAVSRSIAGTTVGNSATWVWACLL